MWDEIHTLLATTEVMILAFLGEILRRLERLVRIEPILIFLGKEAPTPVG